MGIRTAAALGLVMVAMVGLKIVRDLAIDPPYGGLGVQRLLGDSALEPLASVDPDRLARLLDASDAELARLRVMGSEEAVAAPRLVPDAELGRDAIELAYRFGPDGYAAVELALAVPPGWERATHLVALLRGGGTPRSLLVSVEQGGSSYRVANHLVLQRDRWSVLRVPLLRLLDDEQQPWPARPGAARLALTVGPFSGYQEGELEARHRIGGIYLAGAGEAGRAVGRPEVATTAAVEWLGDAPVQERAAGFRCVGAEPEDLALFTSGPAVEARFVTPCRLEASVPAGGWAIAHLPLAAPPDDARRLLLAGRWPVGRRMRFSLRDASGERSSPHLWLELTDAAGASASRAGVVALDAAALLGAGIADDAVPVLAVDLHPADAGDDASFALEVERALWESAP